MTAFLFYKKGKYSLGETLHFAEKNRMGRRASEIGFCCI